MILLGVTVGIRNIVSVCLAQYLFNLAVTTKILSIPLQQNKTKHTKQIVTTRKLNVRKSQSDVIKSASNAFTGQSGGDAASHYERSCLHPKVMCQHTAV